MKSSNVVFENIRFEPNSIIYSSTKAAVEMRNVDFKNIRVKDGAGGVIYFESCPDEYRPYYCGNIIYKSGKVSYLNNGYEIIDTQRHAGFISGDGINSTSFENVTFEYNIINNLHDNQALISIINYRTISLTDCNFYYNIFTGGVIKISEKVSIHETDKVNDHNIVHLNLTDLMIFNSYSYYSLLLSLYLGEYIQNINLSKIEVTNSIMSSLIFISGKNRLNTLDCSVGNKNINLTTQIHIFPKHLNMADLTVKDCNLGDKGLLSIQEYPATIIEGLTLDNKNVGSSFTIQSQIGDKFKSSNHFIKSNLNLTDPIRSSISTISDFFS